jgi:hypothetical protein
MLLGGTPPPGTLSPSVVPNEKMAFVTVVLLVIPVIVSVKVALWPMKGLCGPFPAIEEFAAAYKPEPFGGPTIVSAGAPPPAHRSHSRSPGTVRPPKSVVLCNAQLVVVPATSPYVPPVPAIVRRALGKLEVRVPTVWPVLKLKARSLRFCPTSKGFA